MMEYSLDIAVKRFTSWDILQISFEAGGCMLSRWSCNVLAMFGAQILRTGQLGHCNKSKDNEGSSE